MPQAYGHSFYEEQNAHGDASAQVVLPRVLELLKPHSVADIGCGTGIWAAALLGLGVAEVVGVDGPYVTAEQRVLDTDHFVERDLLTPLNLGRRFDAALCLEVAEHLPAEAAAGFVTELVKVSDAIVFSAAVPGQGGEHHVNEQWPGYWIARFADHGYECWDPFRKALRYESRVAWFYRQNLLLMLAPQHPLAEALSPDARIEAVNDGEVAFEYVARYVLEREPGIRDTVRHLGTLVRRKLLPRD